MTPTPKVQAVGAAGALATLVTFALQAFGVDVPAEILVPATAIATFAFGWLRGDSDAPGQHAAK
jgi:hypothetical protein